jgi:general stress protein YciG
MSGTISGGKKAAQSNMERHGKNFYKEIGSKGGKRSSTGGFASQKVGKDGLTGLERARLAGAKGGRISRRKPRNAQEIAKRATSASKLYTVLQDYIPTPNKGQKNDK